VGSKFTRDLSFEKNERLTRNKGILAFCFTDIVVLE
jgi:hypothetical protein